MDFASIEVIFVYFYDTYRSGALFSQQVVMSKCFL